MQHAASLSGVSHLSAQLFDVVCGFGNQLRIALRQHTFFKVDIVFHAKPYVATIQPDLRNDGKLLATQTKRRPNCARG